MSKAGPIISIDSGDAANQFDKILDAVEKQGQLVQIHRAGKPVAMLTPAAPPRGSSPLKVHPELKATFIAPDAFAPLDDADWPEECR